MTITYSAGTGTAMEPRSEDGLIYPAAFVCRAATLDSDAMDQGATALRTMATKVRDEVRGMRSSWMALPASYEGPEQELVYTLLDEPQDAAEDLWERLNSAALELEIYTIALVDIKGALAELEQEAWQFRAEAQAGYEERKAQQRSGNSPVSYETEHVSWREHGPATARNEELLGRYAGLIERVSTAAANCANGINALQMGAVETGYSAVTAEQIMNSPEPMPWGSPVAEERNCGESFWHGTGNFAKNGIIGATSMVGVDFDPTTARGQTAKQSWIGAGDFVGSMAVTLSPVSYLAYVPGVSETQAAQFVQDRHHTAAVGAGSMVGWDEGEAAAGGDGWHTWREDPVAAATETALNIGSFFIPGAGLAAGGGKLATGAARAVRGGRGGKHLRTGPGGTDVVTPGGKGLSGENSTVFAGGSKVSQGRTDAVGDVDLTPESTPGTQETVTGAGRGDSNAAQGSTTRSHETASEASGATPGRASRTEATEPAGSGSTAGSGPGAEAKVADSGSTGTRAGDPEAPAARAGADADADVREPSMAEQGRKDAADGPATTDAGRRGASERWQPPAVEQTVVFEGRVGPRTVFPPKGTVLEPSTAYELAGRGTYYTDASGRITHVDAIAHTAKGSPLNWDLHHPQPEVSYRVGDAVFETDHLARTKRVHLENVGSHAPTEARAGGVTQKVGHEGDVTTTNPDGSTTRRRSYQGGHIIQHMLGGIRERINITPMLKELNMGDGTSDTYRAFEMHLEKAIEERGGARNVGGEISLTIDLDYDIHLQRHAGVGERVPSGIVMQSEVNGKRSRYSLENV